MWMHNFFTSIFGTLQEIMGPGAAQAAGTARPFFFACATAMIAWQAGQAANSPQPGQAFGRLLYSLLLVALVFGVTLNPQTYQGEIGQWAWEMPREWMRMFARSSGTDDPIALIDRSITATDNTARAFMAIGSQRGPISGFPFQVCAWIVYGCGMIMGFVLG